MFTGITSHAGTLVTTIVVLTGAAILRGGAAAADPNQDDQFLELLAKEDIPALQNVPSLIATAHKVCRQLDGGMPVDDVVDEMRNYAYNTDPIERLYPRARLARTEARFITAAVEAYCPDDQSRIASIMANPAPGWSEPTHRVAAHNAVNSGGDLREPSPALDMINLPAAWQEPTGSGAVGLAHVMDGGVFASGRYGDERSEGDAYGQVLTSLIAAVPSGEVTQPSPPQIPVPPPQAAHMRTAPRPIAPPPRPKQPPPPAVGPQPGGGAGSGGSGGGGPAEPPTPPMPPGLVRLAP